MVRTILFAATVLCIIAVAYCNCTDYSSYRNGEVHIGRNKIIFLGEPVNDMNKNFLQVVRYKGKTTDSMYMRLAPQAGPECDEAVKDYHETKAKIEKGDPNVFWQKPGEQSRKAIGVPAAGNGLVAGADDHLPDLPVYYVVFEFAKNGAIKK